LTTSRAKKFASKPKFRGNEYVHVNKDTGVSEKRQPLCGQSGESCSVIHNLPAQNKNMRGTVNTEIKVSENNFCKSESNFTHDENIIVSINLINVFIKKQ
jgi:hypothetical protein